MLPKAVLCGSRSGQVWLDYRDVPAPYPPRNLPVAVKYHRARCETCGRRMPSDWALSCCSRCEEREQSLWDSLSDEAKDWLASEDDENCVEDGDV